MLVETLLINAAGMGDVLNPTAGTSLDCGLFSFGVFKPACWYAAFHGPQTAAQAQAGIDHPEIYSSIPPAPGVPAVSGGYVAGNQTTAQYDAEVAAAWDQWKAQADAQNAATMAQTAANIEAAGQPSTFPFSLPSWAWVAIGVGVLAVVAVGGGSPARYGR